ncbi:hypothetical protein HNY73_014324 [Argiope bruennichi]|uniref:Uncharacterized protein n=1 Tax=Argiope bruennichi TaxID=94029 RepID=A0A8T0ENX1_ARGBR|nr:hypothetical protein HNY73_014324 [Argiope bruennichi]
MAAALPATSNLLLITMYVLGGTGIQTNIPRKLYVLRIVTVTCIHFGMALKCSLFVNDIKTCENFHCMKVNFSRILLRAFMVGCYTALYLKKRQMEKMLKYFYILGQRYQSVTKIHLNVFSLATVMTLLLFGVVTLIALVLLSTKPTLTDAQLKETTFSKISFPFFPLEVFVVMLVFISTSMLFFLASTIFSLFFISFCIFLKNILQECSFRLKLENRKDILYRFINEYSRIHLFAGIMETAMSLQVFWLCSSTFIEMFSLFSNFLGFHRYGNDIYTIEKVVFNTLNFTSFVSISYFAAEVSRVDEDLRKQVKATAFNLRISKENKEQGELLYRFIKSKEKLVFSAGGVISFTRGKTTIKVLFIDDSDIKQIQELLPSIIPPLKGTLNVHQIITNSRGVFFYRNVSCYCEQNSLCNCFPKEKFSFSDVTQAPKKNYPLEKIYSSDSGSDSIDEPDTGESEEIFSEEVSVNKMYEGVYILVEFTGETRRKIKYTYAAIIQNKMDEDGEIQIMCLKAKDSKRKIFQVDEKDVSYVNFEQVLAILPQPRLIMKGNRIFMSFLLPSIHLKSEM